MLEWLKAGDPPNYVQILFAVLLLIEYVLGKTTLIKANSTLALVLTPVAWVLRKIVEATRKPPGGAGGAAVVALALLVAGCGTPATIARKTLTAIDVANAAAPRFARVAIKACIDKAVAVGKAGDVPAGEKALQKCAETRDKIMQAVKLSVDATELAAAAVDVAEASQAKDFDAILGPAWMAARAMARLLVDAGVKLPNIPLIWP